MPEISKITLPSGNTYDLKDATAREMIAGGISFIVAWDGSSAPVAADIPQGVVVVYNGTSYTGTLSVNDATLGAFYLIRSSTQVGATDIYDEYVVATINGTKQWEKLGDTQVDLSDVVVGVTLNKNAETVLGADTTFALNSGSVTHGTPSKDNALGENTTFTVTKPTLQRGSKSLYIKGSAAGGSVGANGTVSAITALGEPTTSTVYNYTAATQKMETTSIPNVTGNTSVTANKSTWSFTMGTGTGNTETLIIGGGNGSDVVASKVTLGTAITAATGQVSANGTGDTVATGLNLASTVRPITSLGTPTTKTVLTGVQVTAQPTINIVGTYDIHQVDPDGPSYATVDETTSVTVQNAGTVTANTNDIVSAVTAMPTSTVATTINIGTNDRISALTNDTSITVTKGS